MARTAVKGPEILWRQVRDATIDTLSGKSGGQYDIRLTRPAGIEDFFTGLPRLKANEMGGYSVDVPLQAATTPISVPETTIEVAYLGPRSKRKDWRIPSQRPTNAYPLWRKGVGLLDTTRSGEDYVVLVRDGVGRFHARWVRAEDLAKLPAGLTTKIKEKDVGVARLNQLTWAVVAEVLHIAAPVEGATGGSAGEGAQVESVAVEGGEVEGYEVATAATVKQARRREHDLVKKFRDHLEAQGCEVRRNKITLPGGGGSMYTDVYNETRRHLIEAKAAAGRGDVRMAIGQLADYGRFVPDAERRAVLLAEKPSEDLLALIESCDLGAIWQVEGSFEDNAHGELV
jgi:hypothetical protein